MRLFSRRAGEIHAPPRFSRASLRIDADVLDWFKGQGKGHQTRINAVLRSYVEQKARLGGDAMACHALACDRSSPSKIALRRGHAVQFLALRLHPDQPLEKGFRGLPRSGPHHARAIALDFGIDIVERQFGDSFPGRRHTRTVSHPRSLQSRIQIRHLASRARKFEIDGLQDQSCTIVATKLKS